ncbi:MAG: hypothetical protein IT480_05240 [Gammaproteobacteria bacterium]|nr:hypothetical protein [Gammaproteobacteria bacterium]
MNAAVCVLVEYGSGKKPGLEARLASLRCPVERVRTDRPPGRFITEVNEALEFSGYQEGLARVLRERESMAELPLTVVFANDTLGAGHEGALARLLLGTLPSLPPAMRPRMVGLVMPVSPAIALVSGARGYVSTWAFALQAPLGTLQKVRFYDDQEVMRRFDLDGAGLPPHYLGWMRSWLAPRDWLRGWYKACPGIALDETTRRRKELSIYLEHRLPGRLAALGFEMVDLGDVLRGSRAFQLSLLRRADRLHVNRLKLRHRLPQAWQRAVQRATAR